MNNGSEKKGSQFLYEWFGWLPPPRYLSILFFLMVAFGLSALLAFGIIRHTNCESDCARQPESISTPFSGPTHVACFDIDGICTDE